MPDITTCLSDLESLFKDLNSKTLVSKEQSRLLAPEGGLNADKAAIVRQRVSETQIEIKELKIRIKGQQKLIVAAIRDKLLEIDKISEDAFLNLIGVGKNSDKRYELVMHCFAQQTISFQDALTILQKFDFDKAVILFKEAGVNFQHALKQLELEQRLQALKFPFIPLASKAEDLSKRTRIVFTSEQDTLDGLKLIELWSQHYGAKYPNQTTLLEKLREAGAQRVLDDLNSHKLLRFDPTALEIGWSHMMNSDRHQNEDIMYTTILPGLEKALQICSEDATLVLDGHGGGNEFTIGDQKIRGKNLEKFVTDITNMVGEKVSHVLLTVCSTGVLTNEEAKKITSDPTKQMKYNANSEENKFKNRAKILVMADQSVFKMFEKLPATGANAFAAMLADAILRRPRQPASGTAFTFSPTALVPNPVGSGSLGVPMAFGEKQKRWPEFVTDWASDQRGKQIWQIFYKSITLYNNPENRKAANLNTSKWLKN